MSDRNMQRMVQETLDLVHESHGNSPFLDNFQYQDQDQETETLQVPEGCGVIFSIRESVNTFVIDICPSRDMSADIDKFITEDREIDDIHFFEIEYYELAEMVADQVGNRRFPKCEETFCNIGDPGFSWWIKIDGNDLQIYFKNSYFCGREDFIKLGPVGDSSLARIRFEQASRIFPNIFSINSISCGENRFQMNVDDENDEKFTKLKFALLAGDSNYLSAIKIDSIDNQLNLFFHEIIAVRRFWIEVENILND